MVPGVVPENFAAEDRCAVQGLGGGGAPLVIDCLSVYFRTLPYLCYYYNPGLCL